MFIMVDCGCGTKVKPLKIQCGRSFCPECSKRRNKRLRKRLLPYLKYFKNGSQYKWLFLTLSPRNYSDYHEGVEHIRESWKRFLKRKYVRERIKGGFYVVEVSKKCDSWNFHIHAIIYSRYLDNAVRGFCPYCHQNHLRYNRVDKKFYCSNRKCGKLYTGDKHSRLELEFSEASRRECYEVDISQAGSQKRVLNYMLKYVSTQKDSFSNIDDFVHHVVNSNHQRQINSFGVFYNFKKQISAHYFLQFQTRCHECGEVIKFTYDSEVSYLIKQQKNHPPPQKSLNLYN